MDLSIFKFADFLYSVAGIIMLLSFLAKDILWLRTIFVFAAVLNAFSGAIIGLWSVIIWDIAFCCIHLVHVIILLIERKPFLLPANLKDIWYKFFSTMTPGEFKRFWNSGNNIIGNNVELCKDGKPNQELLFIHKGKATVLKNNKELATITTGGFVGEMSFLTGDNASADVIGGENVGYQAWSQDELRKLKTSRPVIYNKLIAILGVDLVQKLKSQNSNLD